MSTVEKEKEERIRRLLERAEALDKDKRPGFLLSEGLEPKEKARWIHDDSYKAQAKAVYLCSACLHWQAVKKLRSDQVMYMKYCPFCGAKMEV